MIRITIIDDDKLIRDSLAVLVCGTRGLCCTNTYSTCEEAIRNIDTDLPDVILMDIEIPGSMSGIQGVRFIKNILSDVDIIMLTVHQASETVFEALRAGASGYLVKNVEPSELIRAIREAREGGAPMSMQIARMVIETFKEKPPSKPLTERQREILEKLCAGKSYQAIANELFITKATVKFHIKKTYEILHVSNKAEAVRIATQNRLY